MQIRVPAYPAAALLLALTVAGCGDGSTGPAIATVEVIPSAVTLLDLGQTQQFTARALDAQGATVGGGELRWTSDDPGVATVTNQGLATSLSTGVARITATVDGVSGSAVLTVLQPDAECVDPETLSLAVGEHATFGSQECFVLPSGASGDIYRVAVSRPDSSSAFDVVDATLTVTEMAPVATTGPRAPAVAPVPLRSHEGPSARLADGAFRELARSSRLAESTRRFHERLRRSEEELVRRLGPQAALSEPVAGAPPRLQSAPQRITIDPSTVCDQPEDDATGILVHATDDLAIYQDSAQRVVDPITESQARRMADYYDAYGKGVIESYFGRPSDIDGNGRMIVFVSPVVFDDQVAAFVWSGDFFPVSSCPASNEAEVIFFGADVIQRMDAENPNYQALETLVHEVKHVVSLRNRYRASLRAGGVPRFQPLWVEEGTAEIAGNMSSRVALAATAGVPVGAKLEVEDLASGDGRLDLTPENYGVLLRLLRTVRYLSSQPNGVMVDPVGSHPDHSVYGTGWHFHRWLGDAYGSASQPRADSTLFRQLSDSLVAPGTGGLLAVTGRTFRELFDEYVRAIAVHETGAPEGLRRFTTYDFVSATDILCRPGSGDGCPDGIDPQPDGLYPWPVTERSGEPGTTVPALFRTAQYEGPLGPTGVRVHDFRSSGAGGGIQVELSMAAAGKMLVVRLR